MAANTEKEILALKEYLLRKFSARNRTYEQLKQYYNAEYFEGTEVQGIRLVYNLIAAAVDRYTDFMSQPPDWQVIPNGVTKEALDLADKQEKFLYAQYDLNDIEIIQAWAAHTQSMLGMFAIEVRPSFEDPEKVVQIDVPPPEFVLPLPKTDNIMDLECVIVLGDVYGYNNEQFQPDTRTEQRIQQTNMIKYYDKDKIVVLEDGKEKTRVVHNLGFIPMVIGQNRVRPHHVEGYGDVDQAVGLQKYLNDLLSWNADIMEYNANPIQLIFGYSGDNLPNGAGAQWHLSKDMDARFLQWQGTPPSFENTINRVIQAIEDMTIVGDATFGRNIPSGTSGAAVRSLLSGIQAAFLRKQMALGKAYVKLNRMIFKITEKYFSDKKLLLRGTKKNNAFVTEMTGKEIAGNYRTRAIFPGSILDQPSRVDLELAKLNAKVQSRRTTMENIGITSPKDELDLIRQEEEEALEREILRQNPDILSGIPAGRQAEFDTASRQLQGPRSAGGEGEEQNLVSLIASIPKIKGSVLYGGRDGNTFNVILTDMNDKSTIVNRLPKEFKGRITFRKFVEDQDDELQVIVDNEEAPNAKALPVGAQGA